MRDPPKGRGGEPDPARALEIDPKVAAVSVLQIALVVLVVALASRSGVGVSER